MANTLMGKAREAFAQAQINWLSDTIKVVLVDTGAYTYSASHQYLSDVPSGARIATSAAATGKTCALGVLDANDITIAGVTGNTVEAFYVFQDTGVAGTSRLIAWFDTVTGLVFTPNSGDCTIAWHASGIVKI